MKDFRYLGEEADKLGARLDSARMAYKNTNSTWAKKYWRKVIDQLRLEWRRLPILHDAGAKMTIIPKWTVKYDFYELSVHLEGDGLIDRLLEFTKLDANLDASWNQARERRLAKAQ